MSGYLLFVISVLGVVHSYQFPENFHKCHLSDKDLDQCLAGAIGNIFNRYGKTGIASINLSPMDPVNIPKMEIGAGNTGAVNLVQRYQNAKVYGLSDAKNVKAHFDQDKLILNFTAEYPELRQEANYNMSGKVMMLSVHGNGFSILRLKQPTIAHVLTFKETNKNNKKYLHVEDYSIKFTIQGAHYDFKNMFGGNTKLSEMVLKVINENWSVIFEDVREGYEKIYGLVCKDIANRFFDTVPFEDFFPK